MSNQEFENYIALIGKLLQLNHEQRDQIAGELQDHLQMRVADLESEGVETQDAIKRALEEFGDAAAMAKNFQSVINHKKRRRMMRFITFSIAGSFVAAVLLMAMWPSESRFGAPSATVAQDKAAETATLAVANESAVSFSPGTERTIKAEQALKRNTSLLYDESPFSEVMANLRVETGLNFLLKNSAMDDSLTQDEPITIHLENVPLNKALNHMLETKNATYVIDDGVIAFISLDDAEDSKWFRLKMYDCHDLVEALPKTAPSYGAAPRFGAGGGAGMGGGMFSVPQGLPLPEQNNPGNAQPGDSGPDTSKLLDQKLNKILALMKADLEKNRPDPSGEYTLVNLVQSMVAPDSWQETGQGLGVIDAVNGVLVVTQSERIHQQIEKMIADLEASVLRRTRVDAGAANTEIKKEKPLKPTKKGTSQPDGSAADPFNDSPFGSPESADDPFG